MAEEDRFEDMMGEDHAGFGALVPIMRPTKAVERVPAGVMPNGLVYSYHCPECARPGKMLYSWAELYIIANGIRPQPAVGINQAWQADSDFATGYGFAIMCQGCKSEQAPLTVGIQEAQHDLQQNPYYKDHPDVRLVAPLVARFKAAQAAAAAQRR